VRSCRPEESDEEVVVDAGAAGTAPRVLRRGDSGIARSTVSPYGDLRLSEFVELLQWYGASAQKLPCEEHFESAPAASSSTARCSCELEKED